MVEMIAESTLRAGTAAIRAWQEKRRETAQQAVDEALASLQTKAGLAAGLTPDLIRDVRVSVLAAIEERDDRDIVSAVLAMQSAENTGGRLVLATWGLVAATVGLVIATIVLVVVT